MINLKILRRVWERINITTSQAGVMDAQDALDLITMAEQSKECTDYLKEDETPVQCIARNRKDMSSALKMAAKHMKRAEKAEQVMTDIESVIADIDPADLNVKDVMAIGSIITIYNMGK